MDRKPVLVVMAAGMGSRYGGLKQIDPVGMAGEAILDYSIFDARRAGFETVIFIIKHEIEKEFRDTVGKRVEKSGMKVLYAFQQLDKLPQGYRVPDERVKPWGTAHAILCAKELIDSPFAVINADDYYGPQCFRLIFDYLSDASVCEKNQMSMVGFLLKNTVSENGYVSRGICELNADQQLITITERTRIEKREDVIAFSEDDGKTWKQMDPDTVVSMNLWGLFPSFLDAAEEGFKLFLDSEQMKNNPLKAEYYLPSVVSGMLSAGSATVKVLKSTDVWYGVTYQADKALVKDALKHKTEQGLYPTPLFG